MKKQIIIRQEQPIGDNLLLFRATGYLEHTVMLLNIGILWLFPIISMDWRTENQKNRTKIP